MTALDDALFRTRSSGLRVADVITVATTITIDGDGKKEFAEATAALEHWISLTIKPNTANA